MKKILTVLLVVGFLTLLTSCSGDSGGMTNAGSNNNPGPGSGDETIIGPTLDPFADPGADPDDESGDDGGNSGQNSANIRIADYGIRGKAAECGKSFTGTLSAKNAKSDVTWTVSGLPNWAKHTATGSNKSTLKITGTPPFATCDIKEYSVLAKACTEDNKCKQLSTKFHTTLPKISIKTSLKTTTVHFGGKLDLSLQATGGSKSYEWTTILPDNTELTGSEVSIPANTIGEHNIVVKVVDSALASRQAELATKLNQDVDTVAGAVKSFTLKVNEEGFVIRAAVIDVESEQIVQNISSGDATTEPATEPTADPTEEATAGNTEDTDPTEEATGDEPGGTDPTEEATAGNTEDTDSTEEATGGEPSETDPTEEATAGNIEDTDSTEEAATGNIIETTNSDSIEVPYRGKLTIWVEGNSDKYEITADYDDDKYDVTTPLANGEKADIVPELGELEDNLELGTVTITAKNALGDTETLEIKNLVVITEPCKALRIDAPLNANVQVGHDLQSYAMKAKGGIGPFKWKIVSRIEGSDGTEAAAPAEGEEAAAPAEGEEAVNATITYSRDVDQETARWTPNCSADGCRDLDITGIAHYNELPKIFGFEDGIVNFDQMPSSMDFKENFYITLQDEGCNVSAEGASSLFVKVPKPNEEPLEGIRTYHRPKIWGAYNAEDESQAQMTIIGTAGQKIAESGSKNIAADCGESKGYAYRRWNWPKVEPSTTYGTIMDLDHIVLSLKQEKSSCHNLKYVVEIVYIIGQTWYYHDTPNERFEASSAGERWHEHEIPISKEGKWFLKCDSSNPDSVGCGQGIDTGVSGDHNVCS